MPFRLLMPLGIIWGTWKVGEWVYTQVRFRHSNWNKEYNSPDQPFCRPGYDQPAPRLRRIDDGFMYRHRRSLYVYFLSLSSADKVKHCIDEDPKTRDRPKFLTSDITLKEKLLTGEREKDKYNYDDVVELPFYYKRWRDRTKEERDEEARMIAEQAPLVYGVPFWKGIKADDLS